jgi:hypothetical protein
MADDLDKLCSKISLTDEEKVGISITEGEVAVVSLEVGNFILKYDQALLHLCMTIYWPL